MTHNILLLNDDQQSALDIQRFLKASSYDFNLNHASDISEGISYLKEQQPDLILLDAAMVKRAEFSSFRQVASRDNIPIILLSDMGAGETQKLAEEAGADDFLVKNKINLFHLQKAILNTLKINETEAKLGHSVHQSNARDDAFSQLLNKITSGVLIINASNTIVYSNAKAYNILSDESLREFISGYIHFREVENEEWIDLKANNNFLVSIRVSSINWDNEQANLFLIDKTRTKEEQPGNILSDASLPLLLNSLMGNILLLKDERIIFISKAACKLANIKENDFIRKPLTALIETNEPAKHERSVLHLFEDKKREGVLHCSDGSSRKIKLLIKPVNLRDEFYELLSFEMLTDETGKAIHKEQSSADRFSAHSVLHLASHDLREPVRTILNYVQLISDNLQNQRYEAASEYVSFAKDAAFRMERLLSDLKTYIGLNDYKFSPSKISVKTVVADALKQINGKAEEAEAEINVADLPELSADKELTQMLIFHLVDNAIKFHKKGKRPVVDIGFDKFEGNIIFCIRDNGIGISKKYYHYIFDAFERLNRVDEYPGNGLGLAICKKIVEMHGGEIWVESSPGSGSNFYFTLKSNQPNE